MITLATLPQATKQEVFDQVKNHLLTQNEKSRSKSSKCAYRGQGGLKCAAGCLIGDDEYVPEMDGLSISYSWEKLISKGLVPTAHSSLIEDLQDLHDTYEPERWPAELKKVARRYNLKY